MKKKKTMITLTDAEKATDEIQHPFIINTTLRKLGKEDNLLNLIKSIC